MSLLTVLFWYRSGKIVYFPQSAGRIEKRTHEHALMTIQTQTHTHTKTHMREENEFARGALLASAARQL